MGPSATGSFLFGKGLEAWEGQLVLPCPGGVGTTGAMYWDEASKWAEPLILVTGDPTAVLL